MKIVIDTNIWISYLLGSLLQGLDNKILSKEIKIVVSNEMLKELAAVLARPKFKEIISYKQIKELFSLIDGYAVIVDAAGEGIAYHVGGHASWLSNATSVRINLTEPVKQALTADTSEVSLHSIWRDVIQSPTTATNNTVGVADVAYAINDYFWGQTRGVASVLQEMSGAASVMGGGLVPSDTTAGAVEITAQGVTALQEIGRALFIGADGEHQAVWLTID